MKTGEDCRYLWVFWSGLVVCWSAGPKGSAPQTKLGSWGGLGVAWGDGDQFVGWSYLS